MGNPTEFNVTILENDDANGIIVFANTSLFIGTVSHGYTHSLFGYLSIYLKFFPIVIREGCFQFEYQILTFFKKLWSPPVVTLDQ